MTNIVLILVQNRYGRAFIQQDEHSFGQDNNVAVEERNVSASNNNHHQPFRNRHLILDSNVHCTPAQFEQEWKLFLASEQKCLQIEKVPNIEKCCRHFSSRRIYPMACGGNDESTYRIYLIAREHVVKFLAEFKVDVQIKQVTLKVKSNDLSLVSSFLECLQLEILLGI